MNLQSVKARTPINNTALGSTGKMIVATHQQQDQIDEITLVKLTISDEGVAHARNKMLNDMAIEMQQMREQMVAARQKSEAVAAFWRAQIKALRIAARIINGDNVPPEDHNFLQDHDPALYGKAMSLRRINDDPTDYESLAAREERRRREGGSVAVSLGSDRVVAALKSVSGPPAPSVSVVI